jgi:3-deoxy-D-arabino-heptulosonate 7-phosphate (DAHP) synthase class II
VYTPETLRAMIKKVSVTSSQIGSRSQPLQGGQIVSKQEAFTREIQNIVQTDPDFNSADTADGW